MTQKNLIPAWFKALIVASLLIVGYGLTHPSSDVSPKMSAAANNLNDVLWIDKYPQVQHDTWKAYTFTSDNIGINIDAHSAFKLTLEIFEFKADKSKITLHFPHDGLRASCTYKIEKLKKPTKHFDTQLTIDNDPKAGGQTHIYYTGPDFRSLQTMPTEIREAIESNSVIQKSLGRH